MLRTLSVIICFATFLFLAGCGDGRPERVPVSGQVLIDGKPLAHGFVRFMPRGARMAQAQIGPDGRFTLSTFGNNDGCVPGEHRVAVVAMEGVNSSSQRWHAPKKYVEAETSGIVKTIDGPTDNLLIELTWDGGAPFVETFGRE